MNADWRREKFSRERAQRTRKKRMNIGHAEAWTPNIEQRMSKEGWSWGRAFARKLRRGKAGEEDGGTRFQIVRLGGLEFQIFRLSDYQIWVVFRASWTSKLLRLASEAQSRSIRLEIAGRRDGPTAQGAQNAREHGVTGCRSIGAANSVNSVHSVKTPFL